MGRKSFLILVLFISTLMSALALYTLLQPPYSESRRYLAFSILPSESFQSVSRRLKAEGLLRSELSFYYLGRVTSKSGQLKAGEYELNNQMSAWEILNVVTGSHVKLYKLTIKEGLNMFQVARLLDSLGLVDETQFMEAAWDPILLNELHIPSLTVEGYLFPETYYIPRGSSPRSIIRMFTDMFWSRISHQYLVRAREAQLSLHEAVILASMIEKETGLAGEMGLISSVFHNRMSQGMPFQSDPTAVYDIMPYGGLVTRTHLLRETPFNTYKIKGLPLTPISNPGILAIRSALYPQKTDYLYFVSRRDGSHYFSATYEEHLRAIEKFLRGNSSE